MSVRDGVIHAPLVLTEQPVEVQLLLSAPDETGQRGWRVFARAVGSAAETPWRLHASGRVGRAGAMPDEPGLALAGLRERDVGEFYASIASLGIGYGPSFERVERLWSGAGVARGEIVALEGVADFGAGLHPTVLDACFQVLMAALPEAPGASDPYVPLGWELLELWGAAPRRVACEARLREAAADTVVADLWLRDAAGRCVRPGAGFAAEAGDASGVAGSGGGRRGAAVRGGLARGPGASGDG